ncbi:hypothetical protein SAMN05421541_12188 [Actinoplanes philippinensis]|uniref:Uncharacterized protein n=1 Tax=Actinoplanes philippinensis TaxID=35752 RepID=A0A1I2LD89_9ACTN|nr:hypothetical protein [Actinoplanes philippinensis]SFF77362.1 hypothetical protein SAMN05421541_12188 [Actinoplanes philippinensis]
MIVEPGRDPPADYRARECTVDFTLDQVLAWRMSRQFLSGPDADSTGAASTVTGTASTEAAGAGSADAGSAGAASTGTGTASTEAASTDSAGGGSTDADSAGADSARAGSAGAGSAGADSAGAVVARLCGVQAQVASAAEQAIAARLGSSATDTGEAARSGVS